MERPVGLIIRAQRFEDVEAVVDVHLRSWRWAYAGLIADSYIDQLWSQRAERVERSRRAIVEASPDERSWLAERHGIIVGLAITSPSRDPDAPPGTGEIGAIYLAPEAAGQGIGRALFAQAVDDLRTRGLTRATLWVLDSNTRARHFYEAAGWRPDGAAKVEERPGATLDEVRYAIELTAMDRNASAVRLAGLSDSPELARLRWKYESEDGGAPGPLEDFQGVFASFASDALDSGRWAIWVAEGDGRLAGNAYVQLVVRVPRPNRDSIHWAYITNVYVEPEHRNNGIGSELLSSAVGWACLQGASEIRFWPSEASGRFYRRAGFAPGEPPLEWGNADSDTASEL